MTGIVEPLLDNGSEPLLVDLTTRREEEERGHSPGRTESRLELQQQSPPPLPPPMPPGDEPYQGEKE
jgi:hypothetical protein